MAEPIITVENLSKKYRIGTRELKGRTFREAVADTLAAPVRNLRRLRQLTRFDDRESRCADDGIAPERQSTGDTIWALKDVSFMVQPGEVVGIIGRNGAGKSTLLKILSRITEPTSGEVKLYGRVSSLLEVGTGFHPELTGRENIYLNGTILGMRKAEIDRKFDEIVDFSEIEKFLDTPVKRYSSGMYVRLAFAVAAHLEPEILLIDEVLAVGDAEFQKKCLGKMNTLSHNGRTVVFVSHNMAAINQLCSRAIHISDGSISQDGLPEVVIRTYLGTGMHSAGSSYLCLDKPDTSAWVQSVELKDINGQRKGSFLMSECIIVESTIFITSKNSLSLSVQIKEQNNSPLYHFPIGDSQQSLPAATGKHKVRARIPPLNLYPGTYIMKIALSEGIGDHFEHLHVIDTISFDITQDYSTCSRQLSRHAGIIYSHAQWNVDELP